MSASFCLNFNKHERTSMCVGGIVFCQQHISPNTHQRLCHRAPRRLCHSGVGNQLTVWNYLFVARATEESPLHSDNGNKHFSVEEVVWT